MKVFLSWSGSRSHAVAVLFAEWLPLVIQKLQPWISTEIEKGAGWLDQITSELQSASHGIVILTADNQRAPWVLFEAGALMKGLSRNRVCTFLVDFAQRELEQPLSQFQATGPVKDDVARLVETLNLALPEQDRLAKTKLERTFEAFWPEFEARFKQALEDHPAENRAKRRSDSEVLSDVLNVVRGIDQKMGRSQLRRSSFTNLVEPKEDVELKILNMLKSADFRWALLAEYLKGQPLGPQAIPAHTAPEGTAIAADPVSGQT